MANKQNYLKGAAILSITVIITKIVGFLYKIPIQNMLGDENNGIFNATYNVYNLLLSISTAGVPVALSRLVASAAEEERPNQVRQYFRVGLPAFAVIGAVIMALMIIFSHQIASLVGVHETYMGIRVLAPSVLFCCIDCVFRGYSQGFGNMIPTSISQIIEVTCKLIFGVSLTYLFIRLGKSDATITAGAISGVTIGLGIGLPIMWFLIKRMNAKNTLFDKTADVPDRPRTALWKILKTSIPITLGSSALSFFALIDTRLIYERLQQGMGFSYDMSKALFGVYSKAQTLFMLPSSVFIVPITVSIVPAIAAAIARRDRKESKNLMESALKMTNLLAMPAGIGMCVISYTIFNVLYWGSNENGPVLLSILGIASFFVCMQLVTIAILQAYGYEKTALITIPLGSIVKIAACWLLVGKIGIIGAPVGMLLCYLVISILNFVFIFVRIKERPNLLKVTLKPLVCSVIMGLAAWGVNGLMLRLLPSLGASRMGMAVVLVVTIVLAIVVYAVCVIGFGAVTKEDMALFPKGERIAKLLHLK